MPRPISKTNGHTPEFKLMQAQTRDVGDTNDCAVKAVALVTGKPLEVVRNMMYAFGRKAKKGTPFMTIEKTIHALGHSTFNVDPQRFISQYPNPKGFKNVTTHQPERFNKVWKDGKRYLLYSRAHVTAVIDGVNHDWTVGKAKRIWKITEVTKEFDV